MDKWIRTRTDIGSNLYMLYNRSCYTARGLRYQNAWCFNHGKCGHLQRDRDQAAKGLSPQNGWCFNFGKFGHLEQNCDQGIYL